MDLFFFSFQTIIREQPLSQGRIMSCPFFHADVYSQGGSFSTNEDVKYF